MAAEEFWMKNDNDEGRRGCEFLIRKLMPGEHNIY